MKNIAAPPSSGVLPSDLSFLNPIVVDDLIRIGSPYDGGYIVPKSTLAAIDAVVSFGLSDDWTLEKKLSTERPGIPIHAYDHTVNERVFSSAVKHAMKDVVIGFIKVLVFQSTLGDLRDRMKRYQHRKATYYSYKECFRDSCVHFAERIFNRKDHESDATISKVFSRLNNANIFLKMDIEGGEYRVITEILKFADRISLMSIEFHETDPLRSVFVAQVKEICEHFEIIHIHGNNHCGVSNDGLPEVVEITFQKRMPLNQRRHRNQLPIVGLDTPNDPTKPDLEIIFG